MVQAALALAIRVEVTTLTIPTQAPNSWALPGDLCGHRVSGASSCKRWVGNSGRGGRQRGRRGAPNDVIDSRWCWRGRPWAMNLWRLW
eukprot:3697707-Pyramimonas_sp.AAC.1